MHLASPVPIEQDQGKKAQQQADEQQEQMEEQMQLDIVRVMMTACMSPACNARSVPACDSRCTPTPVACFVGCFVDWWLRCVLVCLYARWLLVCLYARCVLRCMLVCTPVACLVDWWHQVRSQTDLQEAAEADDSEDEQ